MKKIVALFFAGTISIGAFAQDDALKEKMRQAQCETIRKDIDAAIKATENSKKAEKSSTWVKLGDAYTAMAVNCGEDSMASKKAYETYKKALSVDQASGGKGTKDIEATLTSSSLLNALLAQGVAYYQNNNYAPAVDLLVLATEVNPKDTTATLYAGIIAQQNKQMDVAESSFKKYIDAGGIDPTVYFSLAQMAKNRQEYDQAINLLKEGQKLNPDQRDFQTEIVNIYIATDKIDLAIEDLKKLVEADPSNVQNQLNLGILLDNAGKKDEAMEIYKKVLQKDPKSFDTNYNVGVLYFNEAVKIKGEVDAMDIKTYQKEGKAVEKRACDKFAESLPYFETAKSVNPNDENVNENITTINSVLAQCKQ